MLNSRIGSQRRVLQEVQSRHEELVKMEKSIEELATLFMDLQVLLEVNE
jgi:syntaxin 1B/2/3